MSAPNASPDSASRSMSDPDARRIDVISDVVCPWCYIGKKHLDTTLAALPAGERPTVQWHPFELNPDLPAEGIDRRSYLEAKFGGPERTAQIYERVRQAGQAAGITFDFERIERQPNTFDTHRLIAWAQAQPEGDSDTLVEALFRAYFIEGRYIGDRAVLAAIAGENGFDAAAAQAMLDSQALVIETAEAEDKAKRIGVSGVPFFVFDQKLAVSGAQGPVALREAFDQAGG